MFANIPEKRDFFRIARQELAGFLHKLNDSAWKTITLFPHSDLMAGVWRSGSIIVATPSALAAMRTTNWIEHQLMTPSMIRDPDIVNYRRDLKS